MKCYKCKQEMFPTFDTAWRKHIDGTKSRKTEYFCNDCKIWITIKVDDYSEISDLLDDMEEEEE